MIKNTGEKRKYKEKMVKSIRLGVVMIGTTIFLSFVMDLVIYDRIKESFGSFGRALPDFTILYHNTIYLLIKLIGISIFLYGAFFLFFGHLQNFKKIELEYLTDKSLRIIKYLVFILTVTLVMGIGNAYYKPIQMQTQLFQDQISELQ